VAARHQVAHHDFTVDKILGAAEADKTDFHVLWIRREGILPTV
jgi:hypothetical protein